MMKVLGCVFLWGNISPYVLSYFYHFGGENGFGEKNIRMSDTVFVTPINLLVVMFTNPLGAYLSKIWNPKLLIAIGTSFAVIAALLASIAQSFWLFLITYPITFGLVVGFCYLPPL
jgi:MFS family permease